MDNYSIPSHIQPGLYNRKELPALVKLSEKTIRALIKDGRFPKGMKHGKSEMWSGDVLACWLHIANRMGTEKDEELDEEEEF